MEKGFYTIGALKMNRTIYPHGVKCSVRQLAEILKDHTESFRTVTVKGHKYNIFRYEGSLNGIDNAVILISFPVGAMGNPKALRAFISTDVSLSTQEILKLYVNRWEIEVFFRACKTKLAFDRYQIRSAKGIKRFWILTALAYFLACYQSKSFHFPHGFNLMAKTIHSEHQVRSALLFYMDVLYSQYGLTLRIRSHLFFVSADHMFAQSFPPKADPHDFPKFLLL